MSHLPWRHVTNVPQSFSKTSLRCLSRQKSMKLQNVLICVIWGYFFQSSSHPSLAESKGMIPLSLRCNSWRSYKFYFQITRVYCSYQGKRWFWFSAGCSHDSCKASWRQGQRWVSQIRQIKVSFFTVFECGFRRISVWITVKGSQTCDLPVSLNTNPPCCPDCVVCLSSCVTSSMSCMLPPCSGSRSVYTL